MTKAQLTAVVRESKTKTEGTSGAFDLPFLGVHSLKTLPSSCR
jgi:hypothetical protein